MTLGSQLPIRLEPDLDKRLQAIAERTGTSKSALIRLLAQTFVDRAVRPDGSVQLPPDWDDLLSTLPKSDGRTKPTPRGPAPAVKSGSTAPDPEVQPALRKVLSIAERKATGKDTRN
jgi:predicted DNA-binding protein